VPTGRPRPADDPSVMAAVQTAMSRFARAGILGLIRNRRYELGLSAGLAVVGLASGYALGALWLILLAATGLILLTGGLARAPSRRRLIAQAWCIITPCRVRAGCRRAGVQTRDGRPPTILYAMPAAFGERVTLWCPAGITYGDLTAAGDVLRVACWARDVHVLASARYPRLVVLEVIRHPPAAPPDPDILSWPYLNRGDPEEPAWHGGPGHHRPFGK
jgi:hypothetical protein